MKHVASAALVVPVSHGTAGVSARSQVGATIITAWSVGAGGSLGAPAGEGVVEGAPDGARAGAALGPSTQPHTRPRAGIPAVCHTPPEHPGEWRVQLGARQQRGQGPGSRHQRRYLPRSRGRGPLSAGLPEAGASSPGIPPPGPAFLLGWKFRTCASFKSDRFKDTAQDIARQKAFSQRQLKRFS